MGHSHAESVIRDCDYRFMVFGDR